MMHSFPKKAHTPYSRTTPTEPRAGLWQSLCLQLYDAPGTPHVLFLTQAYIDPAEHVKDHVNNSELIEEKGKFALRERN